MVQIIAENRRPTMGERLSQGVGRGLEMGSQMLQEHEQRQQMAKENQYWKQKGLDLSGQSSETRKIMIESLLKGDIEERKQAAKYDQRLKYAKELGVIPEDGQQSQSDQFPSFGDMYDQEESLPRVRTPPHDPNKIAKIALVDKPTADIWQKQNEQWYKNQEHILDSEEKKRQFFHKESKDYYNTLNEAAEGAERKNRAIERQLKDIDKIGGWDRSVSAIFGNSKYGDLLRSKTAQEFDSNLAPQLEGWKQILGGVLSDSDIRLLLQKFVTASKSPEANKAIAKAHMFENNAIIAKRQIANELTSKNHGYRPANFQGEVNRIYNERYANDIKEIYNEIANLPDDEKKSKNFRRVVPPGTRPSEETVDFYLDLNGNDPDKTESMMMEDGYDI